ncbi:hypothetical protein ACLVWU_09460 [Bdellovibrio sp. HCB290]|uniref:hypothetical protein n=1 Tax=Bdellovibrio sp. HCB290 TaxID=3394356 RepID=UPI0039B55FAC
MKKQVLIAMMTLIPMTSFAKVADFGSMISENAAAQKELHHAVRDNLQDTREVAKSGAREKIVIVEATGTSYNSPTNKEFMRFAKERTAAEPAAKDMQFDRLANEIRNMDQ